MFTKCSPKCSPLGVFWLLEAIHEGTGEPWKSWKIWEAFPDHHKEKWVCCKLHRNPVTPIKEHKRKEQFVQSHFRSLTNHFCPGESDEHWQLKVDIRLGIEQKNYTLRYRNHLIDCPINFIDNEIKKDNRKADVLLEFEKFNSLFGYGIVFEVAISEQENSLVRKSIDWIKHRYSIVWIYKKPEGNKIEIKYPYGLFEPIVKWCNALKWDNNKFKQIKKENCVIEQGDFSW